MHHQFHHTNILWRTTGLVFYLLCSGTSAWADWHGELNFRSEYVYRGYTKSRGNPVAQANLSYQSDSGWFLGSGFSQLNYAHPGNTRNAELEIRPYLGWNLALDPNWRAELLTSAYVYDYKLYGKASDYVEFSAALHFKDNISARLFVAPDAYQRHAKIITYELNYRRDLLDTLQLSTGLGYSQAIALFGQDYFYWNAGFSWFVTQYLALDMRYVDSNLDSYSSSAVYLDNKYLMSITLGF